MAVSEIEWPFVGRTEELDLLRRLRHDVPPRCAVISGPSGVGRSRLAATAVRQAASEGWTVLEARASPGLGDIPFGPFRTLLPLARRGSLTELAVEIDDQLRDLRSPKGLLISVDDGQYLDEATVGLLHQLAASNIIIYVVTTRSGATPHTLRILWQDDLAQRVEIQDLSLPETSQLLTEALGGPVQDSSVGQIWRLTGGNPLYVREVVRSCLERGSLESTGGEWRVRTLSQFGSRLREIVAARLGALDDDSLSALQLVSLGGSLPESLVTAVTSSQAVEKLESSHLLAADRRLGHLEVRISQPLHAEVLREGMTPLRQRALWRELVEALHAAGIHDDTDRIRLACWSKFAELKIDPALLSLGVDATLFGLGGAISRQISEIYPALASLRTGTSEPVVRQDRELALQLAAEAFELSGSVKDGVALANALMWTGDHGRALTTLTGLQPQEWPDRVRVAIETSRSLFWGRWDVEAARSELERVTEESHEQGPESSDLYEQLAGFALNTAEPATAYRLALRAAEVSEISLSSSTAAPVASAALMYLGQLSPCLELIEAAVPTFLEQGRTLLVASLLFARSGALLRSGRMREALELVEWLRSVAQSNESRDAIGIFGVLHGEILLSQGLPTSAKSILSDAEAFLSERDLYGYRPWALYGLSRAHSISGDLHAARELFDRATTLQPISRMFDTSRLLADLEIHILNDEYEAAARVARHGAVWARSHQMPIDEAFLLEAEFRVAPSVVLIRRLSEIAEDTGSALVSAVAEAADAQLSDRPFDLLRVSRLFEEMPSWWRATACASAAARSFSRAGQPKECRQATLTAQRCAHKSEGADRLIDAELESPLTLTRREWEIASAAAAGQSNQEIAERLFVSRRTVESHLQHVYVKLGVTNRVALAEALPSAKSP